MHGSERSSNNTRSLISFFSYALWYEKDESYLRKENKYHFVEETDPQALSKRAQDIARQMMEANKDKPGNLIPVYDLHGNLWWPRQMDYKDIQKKDEGKNKRKS